MTEYKRNSHLRHVAPRPNRAPILVLCLASLTGGCDVFDKALLSKSDGGTSDKDAAPTTPVDGGNLDASGGKDGGGKPDGSMMIDVPLNMPADSCSNPALVPELLPPLVDIDVNTAGLSNAFDTAQGLQCTGRGTPGNDAFFKIQVEAEEKWHFHITPKDEGSSPALYLLNSTCRAGQCEERNGQDLCGPKMGSRIGDEHFTFVAQAAGTWYLGVDDAVANPDGWHYRLFATRTSCGNGSKTGGPEHGEACDPVGGLGSDPNCDTQCRNVLDPKRASVLTEGPVNDDWTVADVLAADPSGADSVAVLGSIGQVCAYDMYAVNVNKGVSMAVSLSLANGQPCPATLSVDCKTPGAPCACEEDAGTGVCTYPTNIELDLLGSDGSSVLGSGVVANANVNGCPAIAKNSVFASNLNEGVYYIRLWAPEGTQRLDYKLGVELFAP